jgi:hypothetical protein
VLVCRPVPRHVRPPQSHHLGPADLRRASDYRGLRIRVSDILDMLAAGAQRADILRDYPYLEDADLTAALENVGTLQSDT